MNSNYNNEFFDAYLRNECSEAERTAFKQELESNTALRSEFEQFKSYKELLKAAPAVTASEDFTDRVVRDIRNRADARTFSWKKVYKGFFSKEFAGVVLSIVLIGALFWPQMTTMLEPTASYRLSEAEMAQNVSAPASMSDQADEQFMEKSAPEDPVAKDDAALGKGTAGADKAGASITSAGRSGDQQLSSQKKEVRVSKSKAVSKKEIQKRVDAVEKKQVQTAPSKEPEADLGYELLAKQQAPAEAAPVKSTSSQSTERQAPATSIDMDASKGASVQTESKEMTSDYSPRMEGSHEDRRLRSPRRAEKKKQAKVVEEEMVQESEMLFDQVEMESYSASVMLESNDIAFAQDTLTISEPSSWRTFPFDHYKAMAVSDRTDTVTVRLPEEELDRFVSAWKEKGGVVIDTTSQNNEVTLTVIPW